jgi:DnaA family protein
MRQLLLDIQPPASPSFDNFVVGSNAEAIQQLQNVCTHQSNDAGQHFIYIWGGAGSGKSHLISACQAANGLLVCVDDVQLLDDAAQIALFDLYNQIRDGNAHLDDHQLARTLIVAGNAAPTQLGLRDDLATRLAWGLSYQLHPLSDEEKALALLSHAQSRGMRLPLDVIDYCLRYLRRDLPTLIATVNALDQWSLTTKKPVTVPMLRQLLQLNLEI